MRSGQRGNDHLRPVRITRHFIKHAPGSVLFEMGETKVICTVMIEEKVPAFQKDKKKGWITAEYAMLPASSRERIFRESSRGKIGGRTHEIQRLIGRSLRSVVDLSVLGERTLWIDCDVIQADGGTRTAAITGAFIAMSDAIASLKKTCALSVYPIRDTLAAISVGVVEGQCLLDLDYSEDSRAEVDMNVVMTGSGDYVEIQGTAEGAPFNTKTRDALLALAAEGVRQLTVQQKAILKSEAQP